jgi:hypothetical protein
MIPSNSSSSISRMNQQHSAISSSSSSISCHALSSDRHNTIAADQLRANSPWKLSNAAHVQDSTISTITTVCSDRLRTSTLLSTASMKEQSINQLIAEEQNKEKLPEDEDDDDSKNVKENNLQYNHCCSSDGFRDHHLQLDLNLPAPSNYSKSKASSSSSSSSASATSSYIPATAAAVTTLVVTRRTDANDLHHSHGGSN